MKILNSGFVLLFALLFSHSVFAVELNPGLGLSYTRAAWVAQKGYLTVSPGTRFWGKVSRDVSPDGGEESAVTYWDVQGTVGINYGISDHFGFSLTQIMYQDANIGAFDEYPYDTFISLKIGSYGKKDSPFQFGTELSLRFPTGERHNILFEDYSAGTAEWGFLGLASYALDPLYPRESLNAHLNLGYWNHNDVGGILLPDSINVPGKEILDISQQFRYALGAEYPTESFDYSLELFGTAWISQPPAAAASRESYTYMNARIKYKPYKWMDFLVSADLRISPDKDETTGPRVSRHDLPNYSSWRINMGAKFILLPTSVYKIKERDVLMKKAEERRQIFEQIIKERRETESAEQELQRIKDEREKSEKELERLKRILEGKEVTTPPDSTNSN